MNAIMYPTCPECCRGPLLGIRLTPTVAYGNYDGGVSSWDPTVSAEGNLISAYPVTTTRRYGSEESL